MKKTKAKQKIDDIVFNVTPKVQKALGSYNVAATLRGLFFFLLVTAPVAVFGWIIYKAPGFLIYKDYVFDKKHVWQLANMPSAYNVIILFWVGMGCIIATVILISLFGVVTRFCRNKKIQSGYIFTIIVFAVVGILLTALSQYFFGKIFEFIEYESHTSIKNPQALDSIVVADGTSDPIEKWGTELTNKLTKNGTNFDFSTEYKWMPASIVWWVMFVQVIFAFGVEVTLQNALHSNDNLNDYEKYIADTKQDESGLDFNKLNRFFKNTFKNSDKSIAKFLIIAALVVVIPNFVYSIIGTVPETHMYATLNWGYQVPALIADINDQDIQNTITALKAAKFGNEFVVSSLPVIMEGLTIATLFFFLATLLRGKNVSNKIFVVETMILFVEVIVLVSVSLASKIYVQNMSSYLKDNLGAFSKKINGLILYSGKDFTGPDGYPLNDVDKGAKIEWLDPAATIAEGIIAYAWVLGCFGLIGNGIYKLGYFKKDSLVTYETGILNR